MLDICLQEYGSAEALVLLAHNNGLPVDARLAGGQELLIDEARIIDPPVARYFQSPGVDVNSGQNEALPDDPDTGFDYDLDFDLA